jgi:HAE1 family hydrophobic/amphiphilic exporter-1
MTLIYTPVMFCVFGGTGIKRRRKSNKAKRELEAYWNEHKNDEQLISAKK